MKIIINVLILFGVILLSNHLIRKSLVENSAPFDRVEIEADKEGRTKVVFNKVYIKDRNAFTTIVVDSKNITIEVNSSLEGTVLDFHPSLKEILDPPNLLYNDPYDNHWSVRKVNKIKVTVQSQEEYKIWRDKIEYREKVYADSYAALKEILSKPQKVVP